MNRKKRMKVPTQSPGVREEEFQKTRATSWEVTYFRCIANGCSLTSCSVRAWEVELVSWFQADQNGYDVNHSSLVLDPGLLIFTLSQQIKKSFISLFSSKIRQRGGGTNCCQFNCFYQGDRLNESGPCSYWVLPSSIKLYFSL